MGLIVTDVGQMPANVGGLIIPTLRYRDPDAALQWLCRAFGFEASYVVRGDDGAVCYAELKFGASLIMLGPIQENAIDSVMVQPEHTGGFETQLCYLIVEDADIHQERAKAAGADIVLDIAGENGSGHSYCCRDPEGHIWNVGTYDPRKRTTPRAQASASKARGLEAAGRRSALVFGLLANALATLGFLGGLHQASEHAFSVAAASAPPESDSKKSGAGPSWPLGSQELDEHFKGHARGAAPEPASNRAMEPDASERRMQSTMTPGGHKLQEGIATKDPARPDQTRIAEEKAELPASERRDDIETAGRIANDAPQLAAQPAHTFEQSQPHPAVPDVKETAEPKTPLVRSALLEQGGMPPAEQRAIKQARGRAPKEQRPKRTARRPRSADEAASTTLFSPWQ